MLEINSNKIQNPPSIGDKYRAEFINGMVKIEEKFIMILDMEMVYTLSELKLLGNKAALEAEIV